MAACSLCTYDVETLGLQVDVTNEVEVKAMVKSTNQTFARIDLLVFNADLAQSTKI